MKPLERGQLVPSIMLVAAAAFWGLFWIPIRAFEDAGLGAAWAGVGQFLTPMVVMAPMAVWLALSGRPTGLAQWKTALFTGGAFALYADSLLLTDVTRSIILFYVSPTVATVLEITVMKRRLTAARVLAIVLGFCGIYVILGGDGGLPIPRNVGDWMALTAGISWAYGSMRVRLAPEVSLFENVFSFFTFAAVVGLAVTMLPFDAIGQAPGLAVTVKLLPWLLLMSVVFLIPTMLMELYAVKLVDPARVGILFQSEVIFGIVSAAILTAEPFGWKEGLGAVLVVASSLTEVVFNRSGSVQQQSDT